MYQLSPSPLFPTQLHCALQRDFGSVPDFRRVFFHTVHRAEESETMWLLVTPRGTLHLLSAPQGYTPHGCVLFSIPLHRKSHLQHTAQDKFPELRFWRLINWNDAGKRYHSYLARTPSYPAP